MSLNLGKGRSNQRQAQSQAFDQTSTFSLSPRASGMLTDQIGNLRGQQYQGFDPSQLDQFMSPYQDDVVNATMGRLNYEGDQARNGLLANIAKSNAFGGSRRGIAEAELEGQIDRNRGEQLASLNQGGWDRALAAAMADNQGRNAYGLDIQSLISQLIAGGFGREGTETSSGTSSGNSTTRGTTFGFQGGYTYGGGGG
jgi:hypothetical protein